MKTKAEWRVHFKKQRQELDRQTWAEKSIQLKQLFFEQVNLSKAKVIHCYLPLEKQNEPNTNLIFETILTNFQQIVCTVPWVTHKGNDMESVVFNQESKLSKGSLGIEEPEFKNMIPPEKIDIIVLPLLAVDEAGYRIGYGKGYYDKYLLRCRTDVIKVALSLFEPLPVGSFMPDAWDVPADLVIFTS